MLGLGAGGVYAILGLGLVVIYTGSGVVNFAQGAIGVGGCYLYLALCNAGVPTYVAFAMTLVIAMLFGAGLHWGLFGRLRNAPVLAKLVAALGVLLVLQGGVEVIFGDSPQVIQPILPQNTVHLLGVTFAANRLWLFGIAVALGCGLWLLYRFTTFGLITRAAAESEKGAGLLGYSPDAIASVNWAIGSGLAALAGILIAPITSLTPEVFSLLILPALAAALVGRFTSFSLVTVVGVAIGILGSLVTGGVVNIWPSVIPATGLSDAIPFVLILIVLVAGGRLPARGALTEGRFPSAPRPRMGATGRRLIICAVAVVIVVALTVALHSNTPYQTAIATGLISAIVGLSVVLITGLGGQISLAQLTFAGVGAFAAAKFSGTFGLPFLPTLVLSGLVVAVLGFIIGLPALRIRGVSLAIVTLGAAVAINSVLFSSSRWAGGFNGLSVRSPSLFGWSINPNTQPVRFTAAVAVILALTYLGLVWLRLGRFGKQMLAARTNERAAVSYGVDVKKVKVGAFALASFIAGVGGALFGYQSGNISFVSFAPLGSIFFFALVYIASIGSLGGGLLVGVIATGGIFWTFINHFGALSTWQDLLSGIALIMTVVRNPDGIVVGSRRELGAMSSLARRTSGREESPEAADPRPTMQPDIEIAAARLDGLDEPSGSPRVLEG
jgi:branched-subunit amino acid ABC-type transport system permease component